MILAKVKEIMAENLSMDTEEIKLESTFEDLKIDSLDTFQVMIEIEEEFGVSVETPENIKSVKDLVDYIETATK